MSIFRNLGLWVGQHLRRRPQPQTEVPSFKHAPIAEDRPLTPEERTLLEWLIEHGKPEARDFTTQLQGIRVVGRCRCGCPTIDLGVEGAKEATTGASQILADFVGQTPEGWQVGVLLHVRSCKLSELEVYNLSEHEGAYSLPTIASLKPF
jgi:hypothetical protein